MAQVAKIGAISAVYVGVMPVQSTVVVELLLQDTKNAITAKEKTIKQFFNMDKILSKSILFFHP